MSGTYIKQNNISTESKSILKFLNLLWSVNYKIFPSLVVIAILFSLIEGVTYQGFVAKYFLVDIKLIIILVAMSGLFVFLHAKNKSSVTPESYIFLKNLLNILIIAFLLVTYLLYLKLPSARNSIYFGSNNLVYPNRFLIASLMSVYYFIIYYLCFGKINLPFQSKITKLDTQGIMYTLFLIGAILWTLSTSAIKDLYIFKVNVIPIIRNAGATYDWKVRSQIGPIFDYYKFVVNNTPESALILGPKQQGQWPDVSNQGFTRYFVYPRNLISEDFEGFKKQSPTFAFLIGGRKLHDNSLQNRWPDFYIPAKKIIFYPNDKDGKTIEVYGDYNPKKVVYPDYWGIIEIDNARWK